MAKVRSHEPADAAPLSEGAFHRISGIGPGIEKRLHGAGIKTFEQLAGLTPAEIVDMLKDLVGVKPEIIAQKDWTGQARRLAQELRSENKAPAASEASIDENIVPTEIASSGAVEGEEPAEHQHYDSYMIELLLDDERSVRRTRITHVKSGEKDGWAGWEPGRLDGWITTKAGLRKVTLPQVDSAPQTQANPQPKEETVQPSLTQAEPPRSASISQPPVVETPAQPAQVYPLQEPPGPQSEHRRMKGSLAIREIRTVLPDENRASRFLEAGQSFEVQLLLDLKYLNAPLEDYLGFQATVVARKLGSGEWSQPGGIHGNFALDEALSIAIPVDGLPTGIYRLETMVMVYPEDSEDPQREGLQALSEGQIIQVLATEVDFSY